MLHFVIADNLLKSFLTAAPFHNFQNIFQTLDREQKKLTLTSLNLENILSSLALETGTAINNLIIDSTSLQPVLLDNVLKFLHRVTR